MPDGAIPERTAAPEAAAGSGSSAGSASSAAPGTGDGSAHLDDLPAVDATMSLALLNTTETGEPDGEPGTSAVDQATIEALPQESALLVVQRGPNARARYLLDTESTMAGRHPSSGIFLDDATVSRRHAEFVRRDGQFLVRDVGALNGTYVNRDRIDEIVLQDGDEVQIGKYRLVFHPSRRAL